MVRSMDRPIVTTHHPSAAAHVPPLPTKRDEKTSVLVRCVVAYPPQLLLLEGEFDDTSNLLLFTGMGVVRDSNDSRSASCCAASSSGSGLSSSGHSESSSSSSSAYSPFASSSSSICVAAAATNASASAT
jgi:hypothetical protein